MTTKKYVLTITIFALLLALSLSLFFCGLSINGHTSVAFYIFVAFSGLCFAFAIVFIAINYKALLNYEIKKSNKKISNLDFSTIDTSISQSELYNKLKEFGYKNKSGIFHKVLEDNYGDGNIDYHYCAIIHEADEIIDVPAILEYFSKGLAIYNIGYIFVNGNVEENIKIIKEYIKSTLLDIKKHTYKYKKFFVPIVIAKGKIYYIRESGTFMNIYKHGVIEGVRIVSDK